MNNRNWFSVDTEGLASLQDGKPKTFVVRELLQNALDEKTTGCRITMKRRCGKAVISVEDDSPNGFKDLSDSWTLFKDTDKRRNPEQRGRFNLGEKQTFAICDRAEIETVGRKVVFDKDGRHVGKCSRDKGSKITVEVRMTKQEFDALESYTSTFLIPKNVRVLVNEKPIPYIAPHIIFDAILMTEIEENGIFKKFSRKTKVHLLKTDKSMLHEMGIPVMEIDCAYSIDVQQKVPLTIDRDSVLPSFLRDLYAEVLNQIHNELPEEQASQIWIREAMSDDRTSREAVESVIETRYGKKTCIATPLDKHSVDEAISRGYRVVYGSEMSAEEWKNVKRYAVLESSSQLFSRSFADSETLEPNEKQKVVAELVKKIAKRILEIDVSVNFVRSPKATVRAQFSNGNVLTFNVSKLGDRFFDEPVSVEVIDLIVHELGHSNGSHTEHSYHETLTKLAGELTILALREPEFFDFVGVR